MARISTALRSQLDEHPPARPILGPGYKIEFWRGVLRYTESGRHITMFDDYIERTDEPYHGGLLRRLFNKWCLGIYIEDPLRWDDDDVTDIPPDHQQLILTRVEDALKRRYACYRIERGPSQQHHSPTGLARDRPAKLQF